MKSVVIAPEYNSVYISGDLNAAIPIGGDPVGIRATLDCINVGCLYWNDGDTKVTLGRGNEIRRDDPPAYDGVLKTPNGIVRLFDTFHDDILVMDVDAGQVRVRVWTNHPLEPDDVVIGVG